MSRKELKKLTELEAVIMDCVWDLSRATVREVQERLEGVKPSRGGLGRETTILYCVWLDGEGVLAYW